MEKDIDMLKESLNKLSDDIYYVKKEQYELERKIDEIENHFYQNEYLYKELYNTWKNGEMKYLVQDMNIELYQKQQNIFNMLEEERYNLQKKQRLLEDTEQQIEYEIKNRLTQEEYYGS